MRSRAARTGAGVILASVLLLTGSAFALRLQPASCPGGRFLVPETGPLIGDVALNEAVVVGSSQIMLSTACGVAAARVKARRAFTRLRARWASCGSVQNVRLKAKIVAPGCTEIEGTVRATKTKRRAFRGTLSVCGDGRFDPGAEECDAGTGCAPAVRCTATCVCEASGTTTTTTTLPPMPASCAVVAVPSDSRGWLHVSESSTIEYEHNPPASGPHYPRWARFQEYTTAVARGYWMHDVEHGGVIFLYRPDAPTDVVRAVRAAYAALPNDPKCTTHKRAILTPDPLLDRPFAVVAADYVLFCDAPNQQAMLDFALDRRGHENAREDLCVQGIVPGASGGPSQ